MRKAKDHPNVPKRYYRPTITTCPHRGAPLRRRCTLWSKYLVTLNGRFHFFSLGFGCSRARSRQGNEMLFVVREAYLDVTLVADNLYSSRADLISRQLLQRVKALGYRIPAVISNADECICRAVTTSSVSSASLVQGRPAHF